MCFQGEIHTLLWILKEWALEILNCTTLEETRLEEKLQENGWHTLPTNGHPIHWAKVELAWSKEKEKQNKKPKQTRKPTLELHFQLFPLQMVHFTWSVTVC